MDKSATTLSSASAPGVQPAQIVRSLLFTVNIRVGQVFSVHGKNGQANMVLFGGDMKAQFFEGRILDGGVDTQKSMNGEPFSLSARYMFDGKDACGRQTRLFIENNGTSADGRIVTRPLILVDNPALQWLEDVDLEGRVTDGKDGLVIEYYAPEEISKTYSEKI